MKIFISTLIVLSVVFTIVSVCIVKNKSVSADSGVLALNKSKLTLYPRLKENIRITSDQVNQANWSVDNSDVVRLIGKSPRARGIEGLKIGKAVLTVTIGTQILKCNITVNEFAPTECNAVLMADKKPNPIPGAFWGIHFDVLYQIGKVKELNSKAYMQAMQNLHFSNIRGPGGTEANFYMHKVGSVMHFDDPLLNKSYGDNASQWFTSYCIPKDDFPPYYIKDMMCPAVKIGADFVYMGNVAAYSPEDVVSLLKEIRMTYKGKLRYEMGNEIYDVTQKYCFTTIADYINKCKLIYTAIKKYDPSVEVAIIAVSSELEERIVGKSNVDVEKQKEGFEVTQKGRVALWNKAIADNPDCYDAVIVHSYTEVNNLDNLNQNSLRKYFFSYNKYTEDLYSEQSQFFGNKKLWLTEWGILFSVLLNQREANESARLQYMKTSAVAIANADKILGMLKSGVVDVSSYHCLFSSQGFGVIDTTKGDGGIGEMIKLPNYYTFEAVGNLFDKYKNYYNIEVVQGDSANIKVPHQLGEINLTDVRALGFGDESSLKDVVLINRYRKSY